MTDPNITSVPPAQPVVPAEPSQKLEYKPISVWAIFGILLGGSVAALIAGSMVYWFATSDSFALPTSLVLILAMAGTLVSLIALWQIAAAEGTRTGTTLATWGLVLSVLTGAGFLVFNLSTSLALQSQANAFIMEKSPDDEGKRTPDSGFIPHLLEGCKGDLTEFNCAFLLTIPERGGIDPRDEKAIRENFNVVGKDKGPTYLGRFYENAMVRFLRDTMASLPPEDRDKVVIEPLGVLQCEYETAKVKGRGNWRVVRNYKATTPEYVKIFTLDARSIEPSGPGERRKWVLFSPAEQEKQGHIEPLGYGMKGLRISVHDYLRKKNSEGGKKLWDKDETKYDRLIAPRERADVVKKIVTELENKAGPNQFSIPSMTDIIVTPWRTVGGKIRISYPVQLKIFLGGPVPEGLELKGYITVESEGDVDPSTYNINSPTPVWKFPFLEWVYVEPFEVMKKKVAK